ncbi:MAG: cyclic peptide export ABC transporter [Azospirillaceae bacterium]|nr:cyclic peptide export ABC transporter [Azospirillaceae bacterium]
MPLLDLIQREMSVSPRSVLVMSAVAGVSNALVMAIINSAAGENQTALDQRTIIMFALTVGVYMLSQGSLMRTTAHQVETVIHRLRTELIRRVAHADLQPLEQIGQSAILTGIVRDTQTISQAANLLVFGAQSLVLVVLAMLYICAISTTAFVLTLGFISVAFGVLMRRHVELGQEIQNSLLAENRVYDGLRDVLDGFKEIKISSARRKALLDYVTLVSAEARDVKAAAQIRTAAEFVFGQVLVYLLLAVIVFVVPIFAPSDSHSIAKATTAILFIVGPLGLVIQSVPTLANANAAAKNLIQLSDVLSALSPVTADAPRFPVPDDFTSITFDGVFFTHKDKRAQNNFSVGPIDLRIQRGETLFVTGGNGSGKSTFMKLLVGLYYPDRGSICIDDEPVTPATYDSYRDLFSVIFTDYHLFKRLHGLPPTDQLAADKLCSLMEMTGKTRLVGNEFETIDLSSGQRKRLALIVAMLEDKPILVLDEWAADQDPYFRRKFYYELLTELKRRGKTIIAVTHDDRYFGLADRRLAMEEGRIASITLPPPSDPRAEIEAQ